MGSPGVCVLSAPTAGGWVQQRPVLRRAACAGAPVRAEVAVHALANSGAIEGGAPQR